MSPADTSTDFVARLQAHKGILYKVANGYCARREERGDLIQEMILELWRAWPRFDGRASFATWMHKVAMNVAISMHRSEGRRIRDAVSLDEFGLDLAGADAVLDAEDADMRSLQQLIAALPPVDRAMVLLYLEGYGYEEIGEMVGLAASNVGTRLNRIKDKWRREHATPGETA
jgi:RNA polymerase sigma-70 factor (ECF subfamily)